MQRSPAGRIYTLQAATARRFPFQFSSRHKSAAAANVGSIGPCRAACSFSSPFVRTRYSFNRQHVVPTRFFPFQNAFAFCSQRPVVVIDVQNSVTLYSCLTHTRITAKNSYKIISNCHNKNVKSKIVNLCNYNTVIKGKLYRFYADSYKKQCNLIDVFRNRQCNKF